MILASRFDGSMFTMGFWHPFGPHGGEDPVAIIERKRSEIEQNGEFTLWSFQYRTVETLNNWHQAIKSSGNNSVFVFCSKSRNAVDPARDGTPNKAIDCSRFTFVGMPGAENAWQPMPKGVRAPHPFRPGKTQASAFVVSGISLPPKDFQQGTVEWLDASGNWRDSQAVPTRGEYLIRPGGTILMRDVAVILELRAPYLAMLDCESDSTVDGVDTDPRLI